MSPPPAPHLSTEVSRQEVEALFSPLRIGAITMPNRIVMAPLTRMRAGVEHVPTELNVAYYAQRASAGLIIAEGTAITAEAHGYPNAPGIYTDAQISGWQAVCEAVHTRGGRIVLQLQHNGRNSHSSLIPGGKLPVAPSAVAPTTPAFTSESKPVPAETPRALETSEIPLLVEDFRSAALNAMDAGFDAVELQAANGHLVEQFLEDGTNKRSDGYGGSIESRARFLLDVVDAIAASVGRERLGVRLSPFGHYAGICDGAPLELFTFVIDQLNARKLAYLHLIEARGSELGLSDEIHEDAPDNAALFRPNIDGPLISAAAYTPTTAVEAIERGTADAIGFGRSFIANPDLVRRIAEARPLNTADRATFYGGGAEGYTDYPALGNAA
jgi:N-ethylmaleimide reductase